ncbi:hypothetical protein AcW2_000221 [Taiwanofungus camphoratus]|nr:hypothetical protein AcW2_000221 [Antrodia cinnamomea]
MSMLFLIATLHAFCQSGPRWREVGFGERSRMVAGRSTGQIVRVGVGSDDTTVAGECRENARSRIGDGKGVGQWTEQKTYLVGRACARRPSWASTDSARTAVSVSGLATCGPCRLAGAPEQRRATEAWSALLHRAIAESRPKSAHRYNVAEQQQIYKSEIERIWKAQFDSLSRKDEPQLSGDEEEKKVDQKPQRRQSLVTDVFNAFTPGGSPVARHDTPGPSSPTFSRGSSLAREREMSLGPEAQRRVLRIKRMFNGEWRTEIIRDAAVINAYVKRRQAIEEEMTTADALAPTGDADKDRRAKKRLEEEIARMKKNQERRLHRKNAKIVKEGGTPMQLHRPVKPDTTRRCGHCGQMGHMKTNRKCPRWAEFNSGVPPLPTASASSPPATSPTGSGGVGFGGSSESLFSAGGSNSLRPPNPSLNLGSHGPSPLATSPPMIAMDEDEDDDGDVPPTASASGPKIKLTLKKS